MTVDQGLSGDEGWSDWECACRLGAMYTVQWDTTLGAE
jgi:hypothetical protein